MASLLQRSSSSDRATTSQKPPAQTCNATAPSTLLSSHFLSHRIPELRVRGATSQREVDVSKSDQWEAPSLPVNLQFALTLRCRRTAVARGSAHTPFKKRHRSDVSSATAERTAGETTRAGVFSAAIEALKGCPRCSGSACFALKPVPVRQ
ncbi:unnamed protein product [Lampetra fluviatilis]